MGERDGRIRECKREWGSGKMGEWESGSVDGKECVCDGKECVCDRERKRERERQKESMRDKECE